MMIDDQVPTDNPGAREIGFTIPNATTPAVSCSTTSSTAAAAAWR